MTPLINLPSFSRVVGVAPSLNSGYRIALGGGGSFALGFSVTVDFCVELDAEPAFGGGGGILFFTSGVYRTTLQVLT